MEIGELTELMKEVCPLVQGLNSVYLFGSRAKGSANPKDYDFAVLTDERIVTDYRQRYHVPDALYSLLEPHIRPLDVVDLGGANLTLTQQVLKYRQLLYCADSTYRVNWEVQARYRIWDMLPIYERYRDGLFRRIEEVARRVDRPCDS